MATRFYLQGTGTPSLSPSFDAGWEQTGSALRRPLIPKLLLSNTTGIVGTSPGMVNTNTQDICALQFISAPIPPQIISGTISLVLKVYESATTDNLTLAVVLRVLSGDGNTVRGTLFSNFNQDTEWAVFASAATRIVNAQTVTQVTTQGGDILVLEIGAHAAAPTTADFLNCRFGTDGTVADYALTSALTTDLNPWIEFSQDLFGPVPNNYQFAKAGDGISVSEKIR